jgi:ABC-2 type transport system permease protein
MYARAWVRTMSYFGEPLWLFVSIGFPLFSSFAMALLYGSAGLSSLSGFAILGGIMLAFWGNVLWSMASQFNWDKEVGIFEIYLVSPAPISAILVGMSLGGIIGTAPSAAIIAVLGWVFFTPSFNPSWDAVVLTFSLTLASLYAMGMLMSSLYLVYGREAEAMNNAIGEPISLVSGLYFPSIGVGSPFPFAIQAAASLMPLTIGMDALRRSMFESNGIAGISSELAVLAIMACILLVAATKSLEALEMRGRRQGSLTVRFR